MAPSRSRSRSPSSPSGSAHASLSPNSSPPTACSQSPRQQSQQTISLRTLLSQEQDKAFPQHGIADVPVAAYEIDLRLAAMQRALVAHDALNRALSQVLGADAELPDKLLTSISVAESHGIIGAREAGWLKHFNKAANKAKHSAGWPF